MLLGVDAAPSFGFPGGGLWVIPSLSLSSRMRSAVSEATRIIVDIVPRVPSPLSFENTKFVKKSFTLPDPFELRLLSICYPVSGDVPSVVRDISSFIRESSISLITESSSFSRSGPVTEYKTLGVWSAPLNSSDSFYLRYNFGSNFMSLLISRFSSLECPSFSAISS